MSGTDFNALMGAVCAALDDDAPRLVLADWYSQHGDPRGEFIVISCELAKHPHRTDLRRRRDELLELYHWQWCDTLGVSEYCVDFRSLAQSKHLISLTQLSLASSEVGDEGAKAIAAGPALSKLEWLDLTRNELTDEGALALANSPNLQHLKILAVGDNLLHTKGLEALRPLRRGGRADLRLAKSARSE